MTTVATLSELDEAMDWLRTHVAHFDNIRFRHGEWSLQLWVEKPDCTERPARFTSVRLSDAIEQALDHVLTERARRGIRGGDR